MSNQNNEKRIMGESLQISKRQGKNWWIFIYNTRGVIMKNLAHIFIYLITALTAVNCSQTISGFVRTSEGEGIEGVQISFITQDTTKTNISVSHTETETDSLGYYKLEVRTGWKFWKGWNGTATPFKENFAFNPVFNAYRNVRDDRTNENYTRVASPSSSSASRVPFIPTWPTTFTLPPETFQSGFEVEAGFDVDQDGKREFAVFDSDSSKLTLFEATGEDNAFSPAWSYKLSGLASGYASIMEANLDDDPWNELILTVDAPVEQPAILVWESRSGIDNLPRNPTATFQPPRGQNGRIQPSPEGIADDLNNDGKDEIVLLYRGGAGILMAIASVEGELSDDSAVLNIEFVDRGTENLRAAGVGVRDIDIEQDGKKEILLVCEGEKAPIRLYSSKGGSFFLVKEWRGDAFPAEYHGSSANILIEDFDGNGKLEAYVSSNGSKADVDRDQPVAAGVWVVEFDTYLSRAFDAENWTKISALDKTSLRGGVTADGDSDGKPDIYFVGPETRAVYQIEYTGGKIEYPARRTEYQGRKAEYPARKGSNIADSAKYVPYIIAKDTTTGPLVPTNISRFGDLDGDGSSEFVTTRGMNNPQSSRNGVLLLAHAASGSGAGGASVQENKVVPATPSQPRAQRINNTTVELSWKDNSEKENKFKIINDDTGAQIDTVQRDIRHYVHSTTSHLLYSVVASNASGVDSPPSDTASARLAPHEEFLKRHANGLAIGDLGGAGMGWSEFVLSETQQDILFMIFADLKRANCCLPMARLICTLETFIILFCISPAARPNILIDTTNTPTPAFEQTHASTGANNPVVFQTHDGKLTIEQSTYQQLNTKWVLCRWIIKNNQTTPRRIKMAMHLDADAAGEFSGHDLGDTVRVLNMVYQKNHQSGKTIGMALTNGMLGGLQTNTFGNFNGANLLLNANAGSPRIEINPGPADMEMTLVSDLETITNGTPKVVYFVLAVGNNVTELSLNIGEAAGFRVSHGL
jgi:hypothetical protein